MHLQSILSSQRNMYRTVTIHSNTFILNNGQTDRHHCSERRLTSQMNSLDACGHGSNVISGVTISTSDFQNDGVLIIHRTTWRDFFYMNIWIAVTDHNDIRRITHIRPTAHTQLETDNLCYMLCTAF